MTEEGAALRKLAEELRQEEARRAEARQRKCAQIMTAATGLTVLRQKLGISNG